MECHNKKFIVETESDHYTIDEYLDIIKGLLVQSGFTEKCVIKGMEEIVQSYDD